MPQTKPSAHDRTKEAAALQRLTARLREQFPDLAPSDVDAAVKGHYDEYEGSPIRDFVPVLVERAAVSDLAVARGHSHRA